VALACSRPHATKFHEERELETMQYDVIFKISSGALAWHAFANNPTPASLRVQQLTIDSKIQCHSLATSDHSGDLRSRLYITFFSLQFWQDQRPPSDQPMFCQLERITIQGFGNQELYASTLCPRWKENKPYKDSASTSWSSSHSLLSLNLDKNLLRVVSEPTTN
jgi:hypothetical protein